MTQHNQVLFVTGANKGLGAAIAKEALEQGYKVVAATRKPEDAQKVLGTSDDLLIVKLDVTKDDEIQSAVNSALEKFGHIDILVNNAGYGSMGYFEQISDKLIQKQIATNLFGPMKLTRAILPNMRKQSSGYVVSVSSTSGIRAVEGGSVYSASKFAIEGWMEGLNLELKSFGIKCLIVEPGAFRTDFSNTNTSLTFSDIEIGDYKDKSKVLYERVISSDGTQQGDPAKLAKALLKTINSPNPPMRLVCGNAAIEVAMNQMNSRLEEYKKWREVSESVDFD